MSRLVLVRHGRAAGAWDTERDPGLDAVGREQAEAVVVTHFICINVAVGAATGDDRVMSFSPANCSRTTLEVEGGRLRLVELGEQARTVVR